MSHLPDILKYPETFAYEMPEYFTFTEFEWSETAIRKRINNMMPADIQENARQFMLEILDPLRLAWTKYCVENNLGNGIIRVTSGYRCPELNKAVGGSKNSVHMLGYAADIKPGNYKMREFQEFVPKWLSDNKIKFDQCILEKPKNDIASWIHIGWKNNSGKQRKQIFRLC